MRFRLGPVSLADAQHVCIHLRQRDRDELDMLGRGDGPLQEASRLFAVVPWCWLSQMAFAGDEPVAIVMLLPHAPTTLQAALLATDRWSDIARPLMRHCFSRVRPGVIAAGYTRVECRTWAGHADARRFLEALGARAECRLPGYGKGGETFLQYGWTRPDIIAEDSHVHRLQIESAGAGAIHH